MQLKAYQFCLVGFLSKSPKLINCPTHFCLLFLPFFEFAHSQMHYWNSKALSQRVFLGEQSELNVYSTNWSGEAQNVENKQFFVFSGKKFFFREEEAHFFLPKNGLVILFSLFRRCLEEKEGEKISAKLFLPKKSIVVKQPNAFNGVYFL